MEKPILRAFVVKIERKCGSETANPDRDEMRKRNFTSLEVLAEQVRKAELQIFASHGRVEVRRLNFTYLAVSAEAELHIFGSQGRTKMRTRNFRSLAVKTERKRNFRSLAVTPERKRKNQIFSRQDRAEVRKQNCRSLTVQSSWTCGSRLYQFLIIAYLFT